MSNREIIEWLKKKAEAVPMPGARKMYEAAAKALEAAQPELGTNLAEVGTDCISREQAIDIIEDFPHGDVWNVESMEEMVDRIKQLPSIQPKRGRWEMGIDERFVKCSECGLMTTRNELRGIAVFGKNEPNFCPNCGAKMEVNHESN